MIDPSTLDPSVPPSRGRSMDDVLTLAVCWSRDGGHLGEVLRIPAGGPDAGWVFGRDRTPEKEHARLWLSRWRPGSLEGRPFESPYVSRVQMLMRALPAGIEVQNI